MCVSVDDVLEDVQRHVQQAAWTEFKVVKWRVCYSDSESCVQNCWCGELGWDSSMARAYYVQGLPSCHLIDADGCVVWRYFVQCFSKTCSDPFWSVAIPMRWILRKLLMRS